MQKLTVLEKNDFECNFDRIEVQVVTVWSSRLGKTPNTCISDFGRFPTHFQNNAFYEIFEKKMKIIRSTCLND